jgi:hypothetical protein
MSGYTNMPISTELGAAVCRCWTSAGFGSGYHVSTYNHREQIGMIGHYALNPVPWEAMYESDQQQALPHSTQFSGWEVPRHTDSRLM